MTTMLTSQQQSYIQKAPVLSRAIVQRALQGNASPRQAIKAKCLTCCNYERDEVAGCTVAICPLWRYRPYLPRDIEERNDQWGATPSRERENEGNKAG